MSPPELHDVVVVGAGPAGSLAAIGLARLGLDVLMVDRTRFPRRKVCGGCLGHGALELLAAEGLGRLPDEAGARPTSRVRLMGWGRDVSVRLPEGRALSRGALDSALATAARREGATFEDGVRARLLPPDGGPRRLVLQDDGAEREVGARVVVAADGLGGALLTEGSADVAEYVDPAARVGVGTDVPVTDERYPVGTVHMVVGEHGYVGAVRIEGDRLNVAAALAPGSLGRGAPPGEVVASILRSAKLPVPGGLTAAEWKGTRPLTRRPETISMDRVFRLGDAAGYVEPFTGEGMTWALAGARMLAPLVARAVRAWDPRLMRAWAREHERVLARRQRYCRSAAWTLRRPTVARLALDALTAFPFAGAPFVHAVSRAPIPSPRMTA